MQHSMKFMVFAGTLRAYSKKIMMREKKSIYMKYLCLFYKKKKFPDLTNLGTLIRCAQNWYTAVQMDEIPSGSDFISHTNTN